MKYWEEVVKENLKYEEAKDLMKDGYYATRPDWNGTHLIARGDYYILLESGELIKNPESVFDVDKEDWTTVKLTDEAVKIVGDYFTIGEGKE